MKNCASSWLFTKIKQDAPSTVHKNLLVSNPQYQLSDILSFVSEMPASFTAYIVQTICMLWFGSCIDCILACLDPVSTAI